MQRLMPLMTVILLMAVSVLSIGCQDKAKLTQLQADYDLLDEQYTQCQNSLSQAEQELNQLRASQAGIQAEYSKLQAALAEAKKAKPSSAKEGDFTVLGPDMAWLSLPGSVLFAPGKSVLRGDATSKVNSIASQIRSQYPGRDIFVIGHTDSDPIKKSGWKDNYELSCQRALAVVRQLTQQGVSASHVIAAGAGEHRPVDSNSTAAGKSKNRRVEIFAVSSGIGK